MPKHYTLVFACIVALLVAACGQERAPIASSVAPDKAEQQTAPAQAVEPSPAPVEDKQADACIDPARINPNRMCTMDYTPVCGCDGKTYSNACKAGGAGVQSWQKGACPATE